MLAPHADALLRLLKGEETKAALAEAVAVGAWDWGVMLVARHLWQQLGLQAIIDALAKKRGLRQELADLPMCTCNLQRCVLS